ncbi:type II secretion system F family protein [Thermincola potens]|uniref:Type II secretion system F domain protein n=1 Tax=Thermincola potens (strain JR) TaxID=635013 RepID=D5XCW4_THEPJ|nr:type II secretion system F family protein [Thermincola potens]ADG83640.1 Type II secretion system F domain protein [Thermincola potens JR]
MQSLVLLLIFGTVFVFSYFVLMAVTARRRMLIARMEQYTKRIYEADNRARKPKESINLKKLFQKSSKIFAARSFAKTMEAELIKADIPLRGEEFVLINVLCVLGMGILAFIFTGNFVLGWVGASAGFIVPKYVVKAAKQKRVARFNAQIGDALIIMANSLRAGFSFLQAMELVSKEMPAPISVEFARALREMNLGTATEEALQNLCNRVESEDLDLVITAVLIQRQVGGNLSQILEGISHTIRERVRIKGEIKTLTAQGRISGMIVGALPVGMGLILAVINPGYIGILFSDSLGLVLIVAGVILQLIGVALIKKIVDIKV